MSSDSRAAWDGVLSDPKKARKASGSYFYRLALSRIARGERVCDAGCGCAFYLDELMARCGPEGCFVGVDFSSVAMEQSSYLAAGYRNAHLVLADMGRLPLRDGCVDLALCAEGLPYLLGEAEKGLQELVRVSNREVIFSLHTRGAYEVKGTGIEFRGDVVTEGKPGSKPPRRVFEREDILRMVERVGNLRIEAIQPLCWADLVSVRTPADWPWYLPPRETIALHFVVAHKVLGTA